MYKSVITVLKPGDEIIAIDPRYFRPTEVDLLPSLGSCPHEPEPGVFMN